MLCFAYILCCGSGVRRLCFQYEHLAAQSFYAGGGCMQILTPVAAIQGLVTPPDSRLILI